VRISTVLAGKGSAVVTTRRDTSVTEAVALLARQGIGALVVSDDGARIDGIVSERDVVRRLAAIGSSAAEERVGTIMSRSVHTCSPEDDTETLMSLMTEQRIRHVPVIEHGRLAGIVSIGDVVKARILELEKDRKELVDYITAR
jgi:CBS domain-containing protein